MGETNKSYNPSFEINENMQAYKVGDYLQTVIVFGGTTEGRILAQMLHDKKRLQCVCVATEYGEACMEDKSMDIRVGRLDEKQMEELFAANLPTCVIDATHPYAVDVTNNIKKACDTVNIKYYRIRRKEELLTKEFSSVFYFENMEEMISWVNAQSGNVFSTLGVKEATALSGISDYKERVFLRVLPTEESLALCAAAGFDRSHVIGEKGPFSYEENLQMMKNTKTEIMLTKSSGKAGGFMEKIQAAADLNMKIAILKRPDVPEEETCYISIKEIQDAIVM